MTADRAIVIKPKSVLHPVRNITFTEVDNRLSFQYISRKFIKRIVKSVALDNVEVSEIRQASEKETSQILKATGVLTTLARYHITATHCFDVVIKDSRYVFFAVPDSALLLLHGKVSRNPNFKDSLVLARNRTNQKSPSSLEPRIIEPAYVEVEASVRTLHQRRE
jgi:hypothetical protein